VTVVDQVPVVNITTSPVSGIVGEQEIKDLPLNGRSFDNLITLQSRYDQLRPQEPPKPATSNGNTFRWLAGARVKICFLLNGVEYGGTSQLAVTPGGVSQELLGIDAVREFNVLTDGYGAAIWQASRSAGEHRHPIREPTWFTAHYLSSCVTAFLTAREFFDHGTPAPLLRNQFGGAAGRTD